MHGCSGITTEQLKASQLLIDLGFVVVLPSHYGRPDATPICGGTAAGDPAFVRITPELVSLRIEEFHHAIKMAVETLPFVDSSRVLAMGHSMGGITIANQNRTDLIGVIITGWGCSPPYVGRAHRDVPQLSVRFKNDPWLNTGGGFGYSCGTRIGVDRDKSNTVNLIITHGREHQVMHEPEAIHAIQKFVQSVLKDN